MNLQRTFFWRFLYRSSLFLTVGLLLFILYALLPGDLKTAAIIAGSYPVQNLYEAMVLGETGIFSFSGQLLYNPALWKDLLLHGLVSMRLLLSALPVIFLAAGIFRFFRSGFRNFNLIILGLSSFPLFFAALLLSGHDVAVSIASAFSAALILGLAVFSAIYRGPPQWYPLSFSITATLLALELVFDIKGLGWWMHRSAMRLDLIPLILVILVVSAGICLFRLITDLYSLYHRPDKKEFLSAPRKIFPGKHPEILPVVLFVFILAVAALTSLIRGALIVLLTSIPIAVAGMAMGLFFGFLVRRSGLRGRNVAVWISDVVRAIPPVPVVSLLFVLSGGSVNLPFFFFMILISWPLYFKGYLKDYRFRELLPLLFYHTGDLILLVSLLAFAGFPGGAVNYHWGGIMGEARNWSGFVLTDNDAFTGTVLLPGTALFFTVFSSNLMGRALSLRERINKKSAQSDEPW